MGDVQIQDITSSEMGWQYLCQEFKKADYWTDIIHGGLHVTKVRKFANAVIKSSNLNNSLAKCLMVAAEIHDLGRLGEKHNYTGISEVQLQSTVNATRIKPSNPDYVDHAHLSANLFHLMPIGDLTKVENESVEYAIRNHTKGLVGLCIPRAETLAEQTLGLLVIADHCGDAACPDGVARAANILDEKKKPVLSHVHSIEHLNSLLTPDSTVIPIAVNQADKYKEESLVAHLVYNYHASRPMIAAIKHLLSKECIEEVIRPNEERYMSIIKSYLTLQKERDAK